MTKKKIDYTKKYDKGGQHQMTSKEDKFKPYYKERDLNTKKVAYNFRLPQSIADDMEQYFKDNDILRTDGMQKICLDFLNNNCFERKYFNYNIEFITKKDKDLSQDDFGILGIYDFYRILQTLDGTVLNSDEKSNEEHETNDDYLDRNKIIPNDFKKQGIDGKVDDFMFDYLYQNHHDGIYDNKTEFIESWEKKIGKDLDETFCVTLRMNNFLDEKSGGTYKGLDKGRMKHHHKGVGIITDADNENYYVIYDWLIHTETDDESWYVTIPHLEFFEKDEWFDIIMNSTNQKLKNFINKQDEFKQIRKENVMKEIEDIDKQIQKLQEKRDECERIVANIVNDNTLINKME